MIADILRESARTHADRLCLRIFSEGPFSSLSYGQLDGLVDFLSAWIIERGAEPGQRICVVSENRPEWVISYLGILRAGCTAVPLDCLGKPEDLRFLARRVEARVVLSSARFAEELAELRTSGRLHPELVCYDEVVGFRSFDEVLRSGEGFLKKGRARERRVAENEEAVLIFTSGTTGASKGVVLSHRNICFDVAAVLGSIPLDKDHRLLSVLPLHHTLESTAGLLAPLSRGASITYAKSLRSKDILSDLRASKANVFISVPLMYEKMAAGIKRGITQLPGHRRVFVRFLMWVSATGRKRFGFDAGPVLLGSIRKRAGLDRLRITISGAAPLPAEVQEFFGTLGVRILEGYGLTEASPVVSVDQPGGWRPGSVGRPIPGVEVKIDAPDGQGTGEILVRGDNVMRGYLDAPEATATALALGWLHTGDLGKLDDDGYLYVCGRSKNVIVTQAGKKIFPEEVEAVLAGSLLVSEVVVVGVKNAVSGREEVHALVYPEFEQLQLYAEENGISLDEGQTREIIRLEIKRLCSRLPDYKRVRSFTVRNDEFPKTSTRKIKRQALLPDGASTSP